VNRSSLPNGIKIDDRENAEQERWQKLYLMSMKKSMMTKDSAVNQEAFRFADS